MKPVRWVLDFGALGLGMIPGQTKYNSVFPLFYIWK